MTKEKAIKIFNTVLFFGKCDCPKEEIEECLKMAIKALTVQPEIIYCKDCKHRPSKPENHKNGFDLVFPSDFKCPCQCDDGYYSWYPDDNWYCANGERKEKSDE